MRRGYGSRVLIGFVVFSLYLLVIHMPVSKSEAAGFSPGAGPSFEKGADQYAGKAELGLQTVPRWAASIVPGGAGAGQLTFTTTTDQEQLFEVKPSISRDGTLTYAVKDEVSGQAKVSVRLQHKADGSGAGSVSETQTFTIYVDTKAPVIRKPLLQPSGWTNGDVTVTVDMDGTGSDIIEAKWAPEYAGASYFASAGNPVEGNLVTLQTNGTYTLYAKDKFGNEATTSFYVDHIDREPPITKASVQPDNSAGWIRTATSLLLVAEDGQSEVDKAEYRVNGGAWVPYLEPVQLGSSGTYHIEYRSVDIAGNVEESKSIQVNVDDQTPTTTATVTPALADGWVTARAEITLTSTDDMSGISKTEYSMNNGERRLYREPIQLGLDGQYDLQFFSTDHAGNIESAKTLRIGVDQEAPETVVALKPVDNGWTSSNITVTFQTADRVSGVARTEYRLNEGEWMEYSEPLNLSSEGAMLLEYRSIDRAGNVEQSKSVNIGIDRLAPVSTVSSPQLNPNNWSSGDMQVELTADDRLAGVARTEYSLNNGGWLLYDKPVAVTRTGKYTLKYRSTDLAGNTEDVRTLTFGVDRQAPATTMSLKPEGAASHFFSTAFVTLSAQDDLSGVGKTEYRINGGDWTVYQETIVLDEEGEYRLEYRSADLAGNMEPPQSTLLVIDRTPPVSAFRSSLPDAGTWAPGSVTVTLSASDEPAGVERMEYRLNDGGWIPYSQPLIIKSVGLTRLEYRSVDRAGNTEAAQAAEIGIDWTYPQTTATVDVQGDVNESQADNIKKAGKFIRLSASDDYSGVQRTEYRLNSGNWLRYEEPVAVAEPGKYVLQFRSIDQAGNAEPIQSMEFVVDTRAPVTVGEAVPTNPGGNYRTDVSVAFQTVDDVSGVARTEYRVNGGEWTATSAPVVFSAEGKYVVVYRSIDREGNTEEAKSLQFVIDRTAPVTVAPIATPTASAELWYSSAVTVELAATDSLSGIKQTYYRIDGSGWLAYTEPLTIRKNGRSLIEYYSVDQAGNQEAIRTLQIGVDQVAPKLSVSASPPMLWTADHQLVTVKVTLKYADEGAGIRDVRLVSITSNEPDKGLNYGDVANDISGAEFGKEDTVFMVRAERDNRGQGRIYTITYVATDKAGNQTSASSTVLVPVEKR